MHKEQYATTPQDQWPCPKHESIVGHSILLGQLALLVKHDNTILQSSIDCCPSSRTLSKKEQSWPIYTTVDWCPPGTMTMWANRGSIHTCSDKLARWNYLGYQGSLLSSFMSHPIYMSTLTVGRKFPSTHVDGQFVVVSMWPKQLPSIQSWIRCIPIWIVHKFVPNDNNYCFNCIIPRVWEPTSIWMKWVSLTCPSNQPIQSMRMPKM